MKTKNLSIKWRLFAYLVMFVLAMLLFLWLFQTVFLNDFYKSIKTREIKNIARTIESNIDHDNLPDLIEQLAYRDFGISISIYDAALNPLLVQETKMPFNLSNIPMLAIRELVQATNEEGHVLLDSQQAKLSRPPKDYKPEQFVGQVPPMHNDNREEILFMEGAENAQGQRVYILIGALISPLDATVSTLRTQLVYISVILLLFAVLLSLFISKKFCTPITELNESAKQLAKGNYNVRFHGKGYREIDELNDTLNKAAFELSRTDQMRKELIANVSHDLRTPLTMITGFAEMIHDLPNENTPENAQVIIDESNRLTRLVSELLDISKLESQGMTINPTTFCITDLIKKIIHQITYLLGPSEARTIRLVYQEDIYVHADEVQLSQVVYNLITNAINYSDDVITVTQKRDAKQSVRIEVADKGKGISQEELSSVWDRYYKSDTNHKRTKIGTGLGLSIVRGVMERHQGSYGVESTENIGSTFWVALPCEKADSKNSAHNSKTTVQPKNT